MAKGNVGICHLEKTLKFRRYWAYLERTFDDREALKRQGCRFNANLKNGMCPPKKTSMIFEIGGLNH